MSLALPKRVYAPGVQTAQPQARFSGAPPTGLLSRWAGQLAVALIGSALLTVWLVSGVPVGDILRFIAFEALYVLLPGCLLYALLSRAPLAKLLVLAIGWPLGYALEIGMFALTAALHIRSLFTFLPLLAAATLGPCVLYKRRRSQLGTGGGRRVSHDWLAGVRDHGVESLLAAGAIAIALALMAFRFFATYPLPEHAGSVFYFLDNVEYVSLAAEALHHWPISEPFLAGHPFRYYTGVFIHIAAIKQVTGVPLAITVLRLIPATTVLVAALQFWCLGATLGRSRWTGPVTVALLIVIENMKLYPTHTKVFGVALFSEFAWSPTYGLGVIFLLGMLILLRTELLGAGTIGSFGSLVMLGILVLGASAVKTTAIATLVGGLGLFWLWRLVTAKVDRLLSYSLIVSLVGLVAMYLLLLAGSSGPAATYTAFAPLDFLKYTVFGATLTSHPGAVPLIGAAVVMVVWKLLPVAGALWPLRGRGESSPYVGLALAVFVVGFVVYVLMGSPAGNESYFIWYGYIALIPVAAASLVTVWSEVPADARKAILRASATVLAVGLVITGATQILSASGALAGARTAFWYLWHGGTLAVVGALVLLWALRLQRWLEPGTSSRRARLGACAVLMLATLGCATSIVLAVPQTWDTLRDRQKVPRNSPSHAGMTAALYRGLVWVRNHTGRCDVLAANTHDVRAAASSARTTVDSGYFYYSAFTERRVLLESWIVTVEGQHGEQPYPALYALNSEATLEGEPAAIRALARKGVSYILIDKSHGGDVPRPSGVSRLVFSNSALDVYRVTVPVGPHGC